MSKEIPDKQTDEKIVLDLSDPLDARVLGIVIDEFNTNTIGKHVKTLAAKDDESGNLDDQRG